MFLSTSAMKAPPVQPLRVREVAEASQRTREHDSRVLRAREDLTQAIDDLSSEIKKRNHSNERPGTVHFRRLVAKLMENSHVQQALGVLELQLDYGSEPPTIADYATLTSMLMFTGEPQLAAELVSEVAHSGVELPVALDDPSHAGESAADILGSMQILVGHYREALRPIALDARAQAVAESIATEYGCDLPAWRITAVAAWKLAQQTPDNAQRTELLKLSETAFYKQSLHGRAHSLFDMDRVDEALQLLDQLLRGSGEQDRFTWWALPFRPSVILSGRRDEIYANRVWTDFARVTDSYNPVHEALDRATVDVPFELPGITAPRRTDVLRMAELDKTARVENGTSRALLLPREQGVF